MEFRLKPAPFVKGKRSTKGMMLEFFCVLSVVWIYSIVYTAIELDENYIINAICLPIIAIIFSIITDLIVGLFRKLKGKELFDYVLKSYSFVSGLILALAVPVSTSHFAIAVSALFATCIGKLVFGGFGYNIVNPAGIGRIFITSFATFGTGIPSMADGVINSGVTVTGTIDFTTGAYAGNIPVLDMFLGNYVGAMGETCTLLLLVCGIYLCVRQIVDYRLMVSYLLTTALISLVLSFTLEGVTDKSNYVLLQLLSGGLVFGAVFMATDPVTTPSSPLGKIIYGIGCAMLTVLIRVCGIMTEGVVFSIVLMNLFTPLIDTSIRGDSKTKVWKKWIVVVAALVIAVLVNVGFAALKLAA